MDNLLATPAYEVREALKADFSMDQLFLLFQPKICVKTSKMIGAEALIRWRHPDYGIIPTQQWISVVQENGRLGRVTHWLTEQVIGHLASPGFQKLDLAINVSPHCLTEEFADYVIDRLIAEKIKASRLTIEITESQSILDLKRLVVAVKKLRQFGVRVALDDFGTAFSSMKYLVDIPVDYVKIDKEFVQRSSSSPMAKVILKTLIELAKEIGACVIVEGVETQEQYVLIKSMGADYVQGYLFSRPLPLASFMMSHDKNWSSCVTAKAAALIPFADTRLPIQERISKRAA